MAMDGPMVEVGLAEEPGGVQDLVQKGDENYAEDESMQEQIRDLHAIMLWTRTNRRNLEEEWNTIRRMDALEHDSGRKYKGESTAYLPLYNRSSNSLTATLTQGLFPGGDYFDVTNEQGNPDIGRRVTKYLQWEFDTVAQLQTKLQPFVKQLVDYGFSCLKHRYRTDVRHMGRGAFVKDMQRHLLRQETFVPQRTYDGLEVSARNMLHVYLYPETAERPEDADLVFEDISLSRRYIEEMLRKKRWVNAQAALEAPTEAQFLSSHQLLVKEQMGGTAPETSPANSTFLATRMVSEVWVDLKLPKSAYFPGEDPESPVPCRVVMAGDQALYLKRNRQWHQRAPYVFGRINVKPGALYGRGFGHAFRDLQYLANDYVNQTNDCGIWALNPMFKIKTGSLVGDIPDAAPGATYMVNEMDGIDTFHPPAELIQWGLSMLNAITTMAQEYGGTPPISLGQGGSRSGKTATQSQILQRNANLPMQDIIRSIENDVMVPLLRYTWSNCLQYRDPAQLRAMVGDDALMSPEELASSYKFRWFASSQATNQQVRTQQLMQILQLVANPNMLQLLQANGRMVDPTPVLHNLYSNGFGFKDFDEFVKQAPPPPPPGMGPPGLPGQPEPSMGEPPRSAVEQAANGTDLPPQPGEAQDFGEVRNGADQISAMLGAPGVPLT